MFIVQIIILAFKYFFMGKPKESTEFIYLDMDNPKASNLDCKDRLFKINEKKGWIVKTTTIHTLADGQLLVEVHSREKYKRKKHVQEYIRKHWYCCGKGFC